MSDTLERLKELSSHIDMAEKVRNTVVSEGWVDVIEPFLNKMIRDVVGGYEDGRWHNGSLDNTAIGEEKAKELLSYKRALVDLSNYVRELHINLEQWMQEYDEIVKEQEKLEVVGADYENAKRNEESSKA